MWFLVRDFFLLKVTNIQISTHPYLAQLLKNMLEDFHRDIAALAGCEKWVLKIGHCWALLPLHPPGMA